MSLESMSEEELGQARFDRVIEIEELNQEIEIAKQSVHKAERHTLERKRDFARLALDDIDAEFTGRGLVPKNVLKGN